MASLAATAPWFRRTELRANADCIVCELSCVCEGAILHEGECDDNRSVCPCVTKRRREKSKRRVAAAGWRVPAEPTVPRLTGFVGPRSLGLPLVS